MDAEGRAKALEALATHSGGFAMVANDGRESLRGMLHTAGRPSEDDAIADFKVAVSRHLGPFCSAMLIDLMYGAAALDEHKRVSPDAGRIVSVDLFDEPRFGPLAATTLDRDEMAPERIPSDVHALKFFVFWHPDQPRSVRLDEANEFVQRCADLSLLSLLEGVVQLPAGDPRFDDSLLAASAEFGACRPDLYKTQVPSLGRAAPEQIEQVSRELSATVGAPWVALSNGVPADAYADVVTAVCRGGASGFLAGRATWGPAITAEDPEHELATTGAQRLREFASRVERDAIPWWTAAGLPRPSAALSTSERDA